MLNKAGLKSLLTNWPRILLSIQAKQLIAKDILSNQCTYKDIVVLSMACCLQTIQLEHNN